jgi:hypothetical protein
MYPHFKMGEIWADIKYELYSEVKTIKFMFSKISNQPLMITIG